MGFGPGVTSVYLDGAPHLTTYYLLRTSLLTTYYLLRTSLLTTCYAPHYLLLATHLATAELQLPGDLLLGRVRTRGIVSEGPRAPYGHDAVRHVRRDADGARVALDGTLHRLAW